MTRFWMVILVAGLMMPAAAYGQGFEFDEEEAWEEDESEGFDFEPTDMDSVPTSRAVETLTVAVIAIPGPQMDENRRQRVQTELDNLVRGLSGYTVVGSQAMLSSLQMRGVEDCVREALCMASLGEEAGVDRIITARVLDMPDGLQLNVDLFDVQDRLYMRTDSRRGLSGTSGVVNAVEPSVRSVLDIREVVTGPRIGEDDSSGIQRILAYSTAVLAVGFMGGGVYFGLQARSLESDLVDSPKNAAGAYTLTQRQAQDRLREVESKALTANVFYGLGLGLAATSAVLFLVDFGGDVDHTAGLRIDPILSSDTVGVRAGWDF